jgi:uncharacterized protein
MSDLHGQFVWYELMTTDIEGAKAFYGQVVGWGAQHAPTPGMDYTLFLLDGAHVAGLMPLPESARTAGTPPGWVGYVAVKDVDQGAEEAKRLGGAVHVPPCDIPDVGRFSMIADPQGAVITLFKSARPGQNALPPPMTPGRTGWHELAATDWMTAFSFYADLFGWQKGDTVPIGDMGVYQLFTVSGPAIGGMFNKPPAIPAPFWLYYFTVADIDAALERVKAAGGQVLMGPMEVPGGAWIIQGRDPQGAVFALVGMRR